MPSLLIASDKFKGSLSAVEVADAVAAGARRIRPDAAVATVPVADGGEGTLAAAVAAGFEFVPVVATGPTGDAVSSGFARRGDVAIVELADVSGLSRLPRGRLEPMTSSTRGTGELIAAAIDAGARQIVLGIGGSAGTDGGAGLIRALDGRLLDRSGRPVADGGAALASIATIDIEPLRRRVAGISFIVACDVDNPLTGPTGAAATYGPQKGARPADVSQLDDALGHWADLVGATVGTDRRGDAGAGAAGGVGFAALALLGAELRPGVDLVLDLVGFAGLLVDCDLVVTGEGALDEQTLRGKTPAGVARAAARAGVPVVAVCGRNRLDDGQLHSIGISAAYALTDLVADEEESFRNGARLLEQVGARIATEWLPPLDGSSPP